MCDVPLYYRGTGVQGYFAHKKAPSPLGPYDNGVCRSLDNASAQDPSVGPFPGTSCGPRGWVYCYDSYWRGSSLITESAPPPRASRGPRPRAVKGCRGTGLSRSQVCSPPAAPYRTGVPRSKENASPWDPTVSPCLGSCGPRVLGSCGGPREWVLSDVRCTPVLPGYRGTGVLRP